MPHAAIVPVSRRVQWIESDTRQGLVRAVVAAPDRIDITARWARKITLYLHDRLVDLDQPIDDPRQRRRRRSQGLVRAIGGHRARGSAALG